MKVAFLDRDGVINEDYGYVGTKERFDFIPGSIEAMLDINKAGYEIILITNQAGIAKGHYSIRDYLSLTEHYTEHLLARGVSILEVYFCPHHPAGTLSEYSTECVCRKPNPGMILRAVDEFNVDLSESFVIGDKYTDLQSGLRAGLHRFGYVGSELDIPEELVTCKIEVAGSLADCIGKLDL